MNSQQFPPMSDQIARHLSDLGESLMASCIDLQRAPAPDRCESLMAKLNGAHAHVLKLRASLMREAASNLPPAA